MSISCCPECINEGKKGEWTGCCDISCPCHQTVEGENVLDRPYCTCDKPEYSHGGWGIGGVMRCDNCGDLMPPKTNTMEDVGHLIAELHGKLKAHDIPIARNVIICQETETAIRSLLSAQREQMREAIEKLRRTDDTQMNADHVYDEALNDVLSLLSDIDSLINPKK